MKHIEKPNKKDQIILDYYYKTKINEEGKESELPKTDLQSKREIWSLNKMENLVRNDETLTNRYNDMAIEGPFKFGYHWNEVIMNILFNEYVLSDRRYMERYLNTIEVPKKRRGNPDGKIDDKDFVDYDPKKKHKKKKYKKVMKDKKDIKETTSTGSAGGEAGYVGYSGPAAFAKDSKNHRFAKKVPFMPDGSIIVESEDYLTNPNMFEAIINQLEEEKRHSAMILRDRLAKENEKNFYNDIKINKEISDSVKKAMKSNSEPKIKSSQDLEKEQMSKEFKPVKFDQKEDFTSEYDKITKGMEDLDYDIEPSDKYKDRVKKEMGEELYNKGRERVVMKSEQPLYNKDTQPTQDNIKYKKSFKESYHVSAKYKDQFSKINIVDFKLNESLYSDNVDNFIELSIAGIGNTYTNKVELNESVKNILDEYTFYYDNVNKNIYHKNNIVNIDESLNINKFKHLALYNPNKYVSNKKK